jgi:hypothetical protein
MSIANLKRSALGLQNLDPKVLITRTLISAAIVLGSGVGLAAPASAGTGPSSTDPNPFGGLSCNCQQTAQPGSPALKADIDRGLGQGHSAWLPGLPAPAHPSQPQP